MFESLLCGGSFNRSTQHFNLLERWSVYDEVPDADVLHEQTEVGDVGPMATRGVDEFDWATLQSRVVFDLSTFGSVWRDPAT